MFASSFGRIAALVAVAALPAAAQAASFGGNESVWLVSGSTLGSIDLQTSGSSSTVLNLGVGVGHSLGQSFELILLGSYFSQSASGTSSSDLEIDGELNFVIAGNHASALYVGAIGGANIASGSGGASATTTIFGGRLGKRFELLGPVSYEPNAAVLFNDSAAGISSPDLRFVPLQFTLVF
jgi:hypothetical protein